MAKRTKEVYRLTATWDVDDAEYLYTLEEDTGSSFKEPNEIAEGDRNWAERTAIHYGIDLPVTPEEFNDVAKKKELAKPTITITPTPPNSFPLPGTGGGWNPPAGGSTTINPNPHTIMSTAAKEVKA